MKNVVSLLFMLIVLWPGLGRAQQAPALRPGDIVLLGYNSLENPATAGTGQTGSGQSASGADPSDFAFAPLVALAPGTQLKFTDNGWMNTDEFRTGEGVVLYTAPAGGIAAGTTINYRNNPDFTHPDKFRLRPDGDQVLVYQGADEAPSFVAALTYGHDWSAGVSPKDSDLPPGLTAGVSAVFLPWRNGAYGKEEPRRGSATALCRLLADAGRWQGQDEAGLSWNMEKLEVDPTALLPGDVLLLGYSSQDTGDFAFAALVDLDPGTQLKFTDNGWLNSEQFRTGEGTALYTAPAGGVPAGTVVSYRNNADFTHPGAFQLRPESDQVLVYQGPNDTPVFVSALTYGEQWSTDASAKDTDLPPGLSPGYSAVFLPGNNGAYAADAPGEGSTEELRRLLTDPLRWQSQNGSSLPWRSSPLLLLPMSDNSPRYLPARLPTDSLAYALYQVFGHLDLRQVPTGYLADYGVHFLDPVPFRGILTDSSLTDGSVLRYLRAQLAASRVLGLDTLPQPRAYNARLRAAQEAGGGAIPLTVQCMAYGAIRPDALQLNLLRVQNNQLYDVPGRSQSPYQTRVLFAATPEHATVTDGYTVAVVLRRNLFLTNCTAPVQGLFVDFGDGQGYRAAVWEQPLSATYPGPGTKRMKVKLVFGQGLTGAAGPDTRESWFDLEVLTVVRARGTSVADFEQPFPSRAEHSGGLVSVIYGNGPGGTKHTQLTKPFIIAEGYNLYDIAPNLRKCNNPNNDVDEFFNKIDVDFAAPSVLNFKNALLNAGYDIVYIDNARGTDDITRNAQLFEEVVSWVNTVKVGGTATGEKNVVMGQSMGGLVSRYGLAEMTKNPTGPWGDPHTRLLVLHDSPQRGANNPVGLQSLTRSTDVPITGIPGLFAFSLADLVPALTDGVRVLNQPATRQLSIYNVNNGRGDIQPSTFIDGPYHQMVDYAAPYDIVATSDGSQCGRPQSTPAHVTLSQTDTDIFLPNGPVIGHFGVSGTLSAYGLPAAGQSDMVSHVRLNLDYHICIGHCPFCFCFPVHFKLINDTAPSPAGALPLETLPGGNTNLKDEAGSCAGGFDLGSFAGVYALYLRTNLYDGPICFVPSYSALDVPTVTPTTAFAKYINNMTDGPAPPRVVRYVAMEQTGNQYSLKHLRFTSRNSEWVFNEMQRPPGSTAPNPRACSTECPIAMPPVSISGPTALCGQVTYSVPALAGATYNWRVTPSSSLSPGSALGSTSNTFTTNATSSSNAVVSVEVVPPGSCGVLATGSLPVAVCSPTTATLSLSYSNGNFCTYVLNGTTYPGYATWTAQVTGPYGPYRYDWYDIANPNTLLYSSNSNTFSACVGNASTAIRVKVYSQYMYPQYLTYADLYSNAPHRPSSAPPTFYPNPADAYTDVANQDAEGNPSSEPMQVTVYNGQGTPMFESPTIAAPTLHLNTQAWPDGLYQVIIRHDSTLTSDQLSVQH